MVKTLVILILLFDGTLIKERYELARPMKIHECLMFADDHKEAITTYKEFEKAKQYTLIGLQLNPKQQRYYPIILCCVGLNEFEEALKYCNKSIEVDPKFTGAYGWKSSMLGHLERLDEAKAILSEYLKLRPEIKNINDYEKVAPTVIKEILIEGLIKAGMPNE